MLSIYETSSRGLVKFARIHAKGEGPGWQTLGQLQGRLDYLGGCFCNGLFRVSGIARKAVMDAARREHGERLKKMPLKKMPAGLVFDIDSQGNTSVQDD